jgi:glutathione S-transferase
MDENAAKPPLNKNYIRLYAHHNCPYCEKVRIVLAAKNIKYENIEMDLNKKPKWH